MTVENATQNAQPATIYEAAELTPEQVSQLNAQYKAMGLNAVVIDISAFVAKNELQSDGTYKRSLIRKRRRNETGPDNEQSDSE